MENSSFGPNRKCFTTVLGENEEHGLTGTSLYINEDLPMRISHGNTLLKKINIGMIQRSHKNSETRVKT